MDKILSKFFRIFGLAYFVGTNYYCLSFFNIIIFHYVSYYVSLNFYMKASEFVLQYMVSYYVFYFTNLNIRLTYSC